MKIDEGQRRIVGGADGSHHSSTALRWALPQAALTGATIDAVARVGSAPLCTETSQPWPSSTPT